MPGYSVLPECWMPLRLPDFDPDLQVSRNRLPRFLATDWLMAVAVCVPSPSIGLTGSQLRLSTRSGWTSVVAFRMRAVSVCLHEQESIGVCLVRGHWVGRSNGKANSDDA